MLNASRGLILFLILGLFTFGEAWSDSFRADPAVACDFLADDGLRTRGSYRDSGGVYRCSSQRRNLVSAGRLKNSIRFIALGDSESVTQLRLELQMRSGTTVQRAHRQLVDYGRTLIEKSLGVDMPEEIESAILGAVAGSWDVGGSVVRLERVVAGEPGYELRFSIR